MCVCARVCVSGERPEAAVAAAACSQWQQVRINDTLNIYGEEA